MAVTNQEQGMIPNTKISQVLLEFANPLLVQLPEGYTKEEFDAVIRFVITVWNAVVMDGWGEGNRFEKELLAIMEGAPKEIQVDVKRLIKRKKKKFALDPRAVGNHWIREQNGEFIFGCEARLDIENTAAENGTLN